ncbi:MAG: hypothetical protein Q9208_001817 [Pyrenodesmia sp. 3 TL-2023]
MEAAYATDEDGGGTMLSPNEAPIIRVRLSRLDSCLSRVQYDGDFMSYRATQLNVDPGLHVDNVGNISLPLQSSDAKKIMATIPPSQPHCLELLHSKQGSKEPLWPDIDHFYSHPCKQYEERLGQQIARFYCICRIRSLDEAARSTLAWLKREATIAHVIIFPCIVLPLLKAWHSILEAYSLPPTPELQETCTFITKAMAERCLGPEPIKPADWKRMPRDCNDASHEACVKLNAFLTDPDREQETFEKMEHYFNAYSYDVIESGNYCMWPKTFTKRSHSWDMASREWKGRLVTIQRALPLFDQAKALYGEGHLELQDLLWKREASRVVN